MELKERLETIIEKQRKFQRLCNKPIDSKDPFTQSLLSETYLFKLVEEVFELRKTFPSALNDSSKHQPEIIREELLKEGADVILFFINFCLVHEVQIEEFFDIIEKVQTNNFQKKFATIKELENEIFQNS